MIFATPPWHVLRSISGLRRAYAVGALDTALRKQCGSEMRAVVFTAHACSRAQSISRRSRTSFLG